MCLYLTENSLLRLQERVSAWEKERGFDSEDAIKKCLLLGEEVGELFKAVREQLGLKVDQHSESRAVAEELADVLILLLAVANRFSVNMETAFLEKDLRNRDREWT